MSNYLNESKFSVENSFKPLSVKKSDWVIEEKRIVRSYEFKDNKFLEMFVIEILKYNRETEAIIETRFKENVVGIIIHSISGRISDFELRVIKDIDKIKKDVMYYYAE